MTDQKFKDRAASRYFETLGDFLDWIASKWPDCEATKDAKLLLTNVVLKDEKRRAEGVEAWKDCVMEEMNKKVGYYKPLERALVADGKGEVPTVYHCISYRDINGVDISSSSENLRVLCILDKFQFLEGDEIEDGWKFMEQLGAFACEACGVSLPRVPQRSELSKYLKTKKAASEGQSGTLKRQFEVALRALLASRGMEVEPLDVAAWHARFASLPKDAHAAIDAEDVEAAEPVLATAFPEVTWADLRTSEWNLLKQIISLVCMESAIPTKMMSTIEEYAAGLAQEIKQGKKSFADLNVEAIGSEIVGTLDAGDVETFSKSIGDVLPMLSRMANGAGVPGMMPGMAAGMGPGVSGEGPAA